MKSGLPDKVADIQSISVNYERGTFGTEQRGLPGDPLQSEDFAKAGPVNYGRVNLACGTNGTEQRGV